MTAKLTPKQTRFLEEYVRGGNASAAYRTAYDAARMSAETVRKRAQELLRHGAIAGRVAELQERAAEKAVCDRAWVINELITNVEIAMGRKTIKKSVRGSGDESGMSTVEVYDRDAAAANAALKLLGQIPEIALFSETPATAVNLTVTNVPQPTGEDHLADLTKRFGLALDRARRGEDTREPRTRDAIEKSY